MVPHQSVYGLPSWDGREEEVAFIARRSLHLAPKDSRRSGIRHSRLIALSDRVRLISLHLSISVDVPLHAASSPSPGSPPMDCRIWEATTRFVRYGAATLTAIRTSRQLANSNLRCPLIEGRYTGPARLRSGGQMKRFLDSTVSPVITVAAM